MFKLCNRCDLLFNTEDSFCSKCGGRLVEANRDILDDLIICKNCGSINYKDAECCSCCGDELSNFDKCYCGNCKNAIEEDAEYCPYCGVYFDDTEDDNFHPADPSDYVEWYDDTFRKYICQKYGISGPIKAFYFEDVYGLEINPDRITCITDTACLDTDKRHSVNHWTCFKAIDVAAAISTHKCMYSNLDDLMYFYNLTHLSLISYGLPDLKPLRYLHNLKELYLSSCYEPIKTLEPLHDIDIDSLTITQSIISTSVMSEIKDILNVSVCDYFEFSGCTTGEIGDNGEYIKINDVSFIHGYLNEVYLSNLDIVNLDFVINCISLDTLVVDSCKINDISALKDNETLGRIVLSNNKIKDISCLSTMGYLAELDLSNNLISDMSPLSELHISKLNIENNRIHSLEWLKNMKGLVELYISNNQLDSIKWLKNLPNLKVLSVSDVGAINKIKLIALSNERPDIEIIA